MWKFIEIYEEKISENSKIDHCATPGYISHDIYKNKGYEGISKWYMNYWYYFIKWKYW